MTGGRYAGGTGGGDFALARFTVNGAPDPSFGNAGLITTDFNGGDDYLYGIAISPDSSIVAAGYSISNGVASFALARYGERLYVQQDANWNVTSLTDQNGTVKERFVYDPYGTRTVLSPTWGTTTDAYGFLYGFQDGRTDAVTGNVTFGIRDYRPTLQRWLQEDVGYIDGANLYEAMRSAPTGVVDPSGMDSVGHHLVPHELWDNLPSSEGTKVWDNLTTGPLKDPHTFDAAHRAYSAEVRKLFDEWVRKKRINLKKLTADQAWDFFGRVVSCERPAIRGYLKSVAPQLREASGKAFALALRKAEKVMEKEGASRLAKYGGKKLAQILVKGALKDVPVLTAVFILIDAKENGWKYAVRNAIVPTDLVNDVVAEEASKLQDWANRTAHGIRCNIYDDADIDPNQLDPNDPLDRALKDVLDRS